MRWKSLIKGETDAGGSSSNRTFDKIWCQTLTNGVFCQFNRWGSREKQMKKDRFFWERLCHALLGAAASARLHIWIISSAAVGSLIDSSSFGVWINAGLVGCGEPIHPLLKAPKTTREAAVLAGMNAEIRTFFWGGGITFFFLRYTKGF